MQKLFGYAGNILGVIGLLLVLGSIAGWLIGLERIYAFYEGNKAVVFVGLTGVVLVTLAMVFSSLSEGPKPGAVISGTGPTPAAVPEGIRCGKCHSVNDPHAKFCNQCGASI